METSIESALVGRRVESVRASGRLRVVLSGGVVLSVANDFRLLSTGAPDRLGMVEHFYPGLGMVPSRRLAGLAGARVEAVRVSPAGVLEVGFGGGRVLCVPPDLAGPVQAWEVSGPGGPLFTALPAACEYLTDDHTRDRFEGDSRTA